MSGFIVSVSSTNRIWYLIGTILFTLFGAGIIVVGFFTSSGSVGAGIFGIALTIAAVVLMIDAILNITSSK